METPTSILTRTVEITGEAGNYRVTKYTHVRHGDTIAFVNRTKSNVVIQISEDNILTESELKLELMSNRELRVRDDAPEGFHHYAVFCLDGNQFARAGSMPIIIVDPRTSPESPN